MATGFESRDERFRNMDLSIRGFSSDFGTGTASSGEATINDLIGVVTSESLTTGQNSIATLVVNNNKVGANDIVLAMLSNGSNTQGTPMLGVTKVETGKITFTFINKHASSEAFNGTIKIGFVVIKAL
jgi:hypothetical protein